MTGWLGGTTILGNFHIYNILQPSYTWDNYHQRLGMLQYAMLRRQHGLAGAGAIHPAQRSTSRGRLRGSIGWFQGTFKDSDIYWMVVTGTCELFLHSVGNFIIPTDWLIFFRGVETTNQYINGKNKHQSRAFRERAPLIQSLEITIWSKLWRVRLAEATWHMNVGNKFSRNWPIIIASKKHASIKQQWWQVERKSRYLTILHWECVADLVWKILVQ